LRDTTTLVNALGRRGMYGGDERICLRSSAIGIIFLSAAEATREFDKALKTILALRIRLPGFDGRV